VAWLQKQKWKAHSPELAASDFYILGSFTNFLSGKTFEDQHAFQEIVMQNFKSVGKENYFLQ
jgi:hypothetical protein